MGELDLASIVCSANKRLRVESLVTMHSGNVSGIDRSNNVLIIKPSGMDYEEMSPESMVEVDFESGTSRSTLKPSVDLPHHLYLYKQDSQIGGVVHTHSNYATAFAAMGMSIPLVLTAIADEFGGEIPCAPYVDNQGDNIGRAIMQYRTQAPAILLQNHGVFAWGKTVKDALKAAIMVEDVAKTVHLAMQLGTPAHLDPQEALKWWNRYHSTYGQK